MADNLNLSKYFNGGQPSAQELLILATKVRANISRKDYTMLSTLPPLSGSIPSEAISNFCEDQNEHLIDLVLQFCRNLDSKDILLLIEDLLYQVNSISAVEKYPVIEWGDEVKNREIVDAFIKSQSEFNKTTGQLNINIGIQNFVTFLVNCIEYLSEPALNYLLNQITDKKREEISTIIN